MLGLCELAARAILPAPPNGARQPQIVYRYDPEIRYVYVPNQRGWIDDGFVSINSLGFSGPDVAVPKPVGRFRVVSHRRFRHVWAGASLTTRRSPPSSSSCSTNDFRVAIWTW